MTTKLISEQLTDRHVSKAVRRDLTTLLQPRTLNQGDGEFGIGREYQKAEMRTYLEQRLGAFPWT
jgi:hypothetical protein